MLTVGQLSLLIKETMEDSFPSVWVTGEISNLRRPNSGHLYFDLKDEAAVLNSVVWRSTAARLRFHIEDGQQVNCHGAIDVYPPHGKYQLVVRRVEPVGEGALQLAFRQLHARLESEGLFDPQYKKPLPSFPERIAVVTSPTGAAIRDFLKIARRRWPSTKVSVIPSRVQGDGAAAEIATGIEQANRLRPRPDIVIAGRGGGSLEDLWCFNEELVVRAIFSSEIPLVSAVGHEVDVTLADLVADLRAPTPSAAAELCLPDERELRERLAQLQHRVRSLLLANATRARDRLNALAASRPFRHPKSWLHDHAQNLDDLQQRGHSAITRRTQSALTQANATAARLEALSPIAVLRRGYSLTSREVGGETIHDASSVNVDDLIHTRLERGRLVSRVEESVEE